MSQSPYNWDRNGDNKLDANDIMAGFDLNNDGILDESELSKLAEQLTSQLEYNTNILKELNNAEQSHLSTQRELKARQENISQLTNNIELQRLEGVELKRKLKLSQEVSDDMAKHSKDTRLELEYIKKELDISQKALLDANRKNNIIEQENSKNYVELNELKKELKERKDESSKVQYAIQSDLSLIQNAYESSRNELTRLRAKVSPLEIDKIGLVDHVNELKYALEEMTTSRGIESEARDIAEQKWKQLEMNVEKKHSIGLDLQYKIQDIESKLEKSKEIIDHNLCHIQDLEGIIEELENNKEINLKSIQHSIDENHLLELELDNKTSELEQMVTQRLEEQQNWANKNIKNKEEMQRIIEGIKNHSKEFTEDSQKRAAEAFDSRSIAEDKCLEMQAECGKLHEIIEGMQKEHSNSLQSMGNQRKSLQEKLLLCQQENSKLEDERNQSNKQV
jgi:chromosome segregation ATPase